MSFYYLDPASALDTSPISPYNTTYHKTHWSNLAKLILFLLTHDHRRVFDESVATFCVTSADRACEQPTFCGNKTLAVIDTVDMDLERPRCASLWNKCDKNLPGRVSDRIVRIIGSDAVLRPMKRECLRVSVPWISHLYEPSITSNISSNVSGKISATKTLRVSGSWNSRDHGLATRYGFTKWRIDLRNACFKYNSECEWRYQNLAGGRAFHALELYTKSRFCLMPPGDTIVRQAIADAISLGCIPIFFHPKQRELWPRFWNASNASLLFNITTGPSAIDDMFKTLIEFDPEREELLRKELMRVAPQLMYTARRSPNALDLLLSTMTDAAMQRRYT